MSRETLSHAQLIDRYTDQPQRLPFKMREKIEKHWGNKPVVLYALCDLNAELKIDTIWVALGADYLTIVKTKEDGIDSFTNIKLDQIKELKDAPGLSSSTLRILGKPGEPSLAVLHYTNRQRRMMETMKFLIEQSIDGREVSHGKDPDEAYQKSTTYPVRDAQASIAVNKLAVVWRLMTYMKPYKVKFILGVLAMVLLTAVSLLPAYLTGHLIDHIIKPFQSGEMDYDAAMKMAWMVIGGLIATYAVRTLMMWIRLRTMSVLGELVARDLRTHLYEHMQTLGMRFFSSKHTGTLISRVSSDSDRLWDFVAFGVVEVLWAVIMLSGLGTVLVILDWQLGLILTLPIPIFIWSFFRHGIQMQTMFLRAWRKWSAMTAVLSDTIPGIRVVKAFNQEKREKNRFKQHNYAVVDEFNEIHTVWTKFWPFIVVGVHTITVLVWIFALPRVMGQGAPLSVGVFVTFLLYMSMYLQPIEVIGMMARMLNRATSSAHRIFEVLDTEPEINNIENPIKLSPVEGRVTFDNVVFAYDGIRQVVKGVSFDVKPGEMIGLCGSSGAGKTTLTNLIVRFYDITGGRILIDGVDLHKLDIGDFRKQVGIVLQDPYLFYGSVLENIRYSDKTASLERVIEAAKIANAHDFICKLPHGYDTIIGERGQTLSGGERQRVSIARAILPNPRILILDEATSSVDSETELKIQEALDRLVRGRTVFAIAHRLSTLRRADRLFVLDNGKIIEEGTHDELMRIPDGQFAKLIKMQQQLHEAGKV